MKSKILSQLFLVVSLGIIYLTMSSDKTGIYNGGTSCGTCHGNKNTATSVAITGLPTTFVPSQVYPLTFTVTNSANPKAGFNILVNGGTFTAGTGSKVNTAKTQITHTAAMSAASGVTTFSFSWTAPATTAAVTFSAVGNSVNGNNTDDSGDMWNTTTATVSGAFPASVNNINEQTIAMYPNPATEYIVAEGINSNAKNIAVYNVYGQFLKPTYSFNANDCRIDCSQFASGLYFISATVEGKIAKASFIKK